MRGARILRISQTAHLLLAAIRKEKKKKFRKKESGIEKRAASTGISKRSFCDAPLENYAAGMVTVSITVELASLNPAGGIRHNMLIWNDDSGKIYE